MQRCRFIPLIPGNCFNYTRIELSCVGGSLSLLRDNGERCNAGALEPLRSLQRAPRLGPRARDPIRRTCCSSGGPPDGRQKRFSGLAAVGGPSPDYPPDKAFTEFENLRLERELCQFSARTVPMGLLLLHQSQDRAVESVSRAKMQHKEVIILCLEDCSDWSIATNGRAVMQVEVLSTSYCISSPLLRFLKFR